MRQSREKMRPSFRRFERGDVEDGILEPIVESLRAIISILMMGTLGSLLERRISSLPSPPH